MATAQGDGTAPRQTGIREGRAASAIRRARVPADAERSTAPRRAEAAADRIAALAGAAEAGARLGTKDELRTMCQVSVGTFNEALRLLQSRGVVTVRPGPGGGLFAAEQSPMVRLGNSVLALDARQTDVADAVRIRDAIDPLLIEDALWHASPADIADLRRQLDVMRAAAEAADPDAFVRANWGLHARIAAISPNPLLRSLYDSLLEIIESHTLSVLPISGLSLPDYIHERHALHVSLVDALDARDRGRAIELTRAHNTSVNRQSEHPTS
ncbi:FadR/GntR family transcriptional regulator [Streptomyces kasugaensis]|uniref:FadR/GntR family transcriptional regulator n=1 Tax=Streptomyces kasugaensis TaxID=1946 RepID=UPI001F5EDA09|nr:FCD domain-containing protein [Streptomyces kasugaensis]